MKKAILVLGIAMALAATGFAERVSGQFKTSKDAIKPTAVVAMPVRSPSDPLKWVTAVVLSEGTMDAAKAVQALDPHTALSNQEGMRGKNYISFWIQPDGYVGMNATFSKGMVQYIDSTKNKEGEGGITAESLEATFTENSPKRVAGRIRTMKPAKTMSGETYELDVEFDTRLTRPAAGTKLGAGGGEPGKAFLAFIAAMKAKNWKGVQAGASAKILEDVDSEATDAEKAQSVIDSVSFLLPRGKKMKILEGEQINDTTVLELQGEMSEEGEGDALYLVRMLKEQGSWRFDHCGVVGFL